MDQSKWSNGDFHPPLDMDQSHYFEVVRFIGQYFQRFDNIVYPSVEALRDIKVQSLLWTEVFDPVGVKVPFPLSYQKRVLKRLLDECVNAAEGHDIAFSDHLFQRYTELCTEPDRVSDIEAAQQKELLSYMIPYTHPGAHRITLYIEEKPKLLSGSGTTGFRTWPAALHLGTYLADPANHNLVIGKRILDLGAGTGLVSLLCTWLGAETVLATDREEEIIEAIYNNIHHNQPLMGNRTPRMDTEILDWNSHASLVRCLELQHLSVREAPPNNNQDNINVSGPEALQHLQHQDSIKNAPAVDLILGADIIYDPSVFHGLVATIITLLTARADPPPRCIIAVTVRNLATIAAFRDICERMNLHVRDIEYECKPHERQEGMYHRHGPDQRIWILEVERNGLMTMR